MKVGDYCGGIRSVEDLMNRCVIDEFCGCWVYKGAKQGGSPKIRFRFPSGKQQVARGRRAAVCIATGKDVPKGMVAFAKPECEHTDCVNPSHCRTGTKVEWGIAQRGKPTSFKKLQANTANGMKRAKLTVGQARAIRASLKTITQLAEEFGVVNSRISEIRRGNGFREQFAGASVFTWKGIA